MNARCYRCGWSFSLSRETMAAAVAAADARGDKYHVEPCPRCKQAVKLPLDQLRQALPANWTPAVSAGPAATPAAEEPAAPPVEASAGEPPATPPAKDKPRHRHAGHKAE